MSRKNKIHIVVHTHWDREWYYTLEEYRYRLIKMMDTLIDSMEQDAVTYFTLDGQTIMLRDYLEIRPENRDRLKALIQAGRLLIGPWFTQPNLFMSCGEAQIQNLLAGQRNMKEWGGGMPDINYLPDQFGFPAQLPQIMENFDMTHVIGGRGICPRVAIPISSGKDLMEPLWACVL
jgi:alpha-mannosidase